MEGEDMWFIQEAHVLPDGQQIIFYGGQQKSVGASGNGQQWWWIPVTGGEPQPYSGTGGNMILGYAPHPTGANVAYAESAHVSACLSDQRLVIRGAEPGPGVQVQAPVPASIEESASDSFWIHGFSWNPDGSHVAYAVQQYRCPTSGSEYEVGQGEIYTWLVGQGSGVEGGAPRKLVDGFFPVWIR